MKSCWMFIETFSRATEKFKHLYSDTNFIKLARFFRNLIV